jgi:MFS transporter, DHA2 family, methylenomycin A resistance protein
MFAGNRRMKLITLGTMCFALFMVMLDSTVVNLALPTIQRKLNASLAELQWIVDAYVLLLASLLLTGGTLGDLFGRRKAFIGGLGLFTLSSFACALAPGIGMLIAARAVQGVGAAIMMPSTLSILTNTFPDPRERAQAIGMWAGVSGLALAVGPVVGGSMVDSFGWQSIFLINVPIGLIAVVVAWRFVPESAQREGRSLDLPGQALAIVGLAALTYAFIEANKYGWSSARIISLFACAAVALGAFGVVEARSKSPMLQLKFFRNITFTGANIVGLVISFGFFGIIFFMSLFWQNVQGYSATRSGVLSLPMTLGVMSAAIVSGRVVGRIGARLPIALGLTMTGAGLLLLITVHFDSSYSVQWPWLLLIGLGNGLAMSPMTTAIMSTVPGNRAGMASATSNTMRQTGSVFGIAVLGSIVTSHYIGVLTGKVQAMHLPPIVQERVLAIAAQGRQAMPKHVPAGIDVVAIGRAIGESFTSGLHVGLWVSGLLLLGGVPIALYTIRDTMPGAQPAVANAPAAAAVPVAPAVEALPAED